MIQLGVWLDRLNGRTLGSLRCRKGTIGTITFILYDRVDRLANKLMWKGVAG